MAANEVYVRNHLYFVPLADLQPDPNQPRKYLDATALEELTASIVQHGVLEPILFRQENGLFYVVAGGKAELHHCPGEYETVCREYAGCGDRGKTEQKFSMKMISRCVRSFIISYI